MTELLPNRLSVVWTNAARGGAMKSRVELAMERRLIELHGSVEEMAQCKREFLIQGEPPGHIYVRRYCQAHADAVKPLLPSEQCKVEFRLTFFQG